MAKRPGGAGESSVPPPAKRPSVAAMSPIDIGPACGEEDLNINVLQVQNKKLSERLRERNFTREQLETRVEEAENRVEEQRLALASLPRHLQAVRDHLTPLLPPHVSLDSLARVWEEARPEMCLEEGFRCVLAALKTLEPREGVEERKTEMLSPSQLEEERDRLLDEARSLHGRCEELESALADARFDLDRSMSRAQRLERQLTDALERSPVAVQTGSSTQEVTTAPPAVQPTAEKTSADDVSSELEEANAIAEGRLKECEQLSQQIVDLRSELELAREASVVADVENSTPYLALQSQFSIIQLENSQLRSLVEELKSLLYEARAHHFSQLDELRAEEVKYENDVREEMAQLETLLATSKRDYELLRIEFEKRMASNEQAAPLARELKVTVDSLRKTISQLKSEVERYKTRAHKAEGRLQEEANNKKTTNIQPTVAEGTGGGRETTTTSHTTSDEQQLLVNKVKTLHEEKRALEEKLGVFSQSSEEERDKALILASEKKAKGQVEELRRKCEELRRDYEKRKEHLREEGARRCKALAEDNKQLQRELVAKRQEAQALVQEMECTAEAFEEVQEQNLRLLQQIREKDDANFKVISERIKASSMQKLLMEEKELLHSQISNLNQEKNRMAEVMARLEEKDKNQEGSLAAMEKDLALKLQAVETFKKKAQESTLTAQNLQLAVAGEEREREGHREKVREREEEREKAGQQLRRYQEEVASLKRKLEKYKSREWASSSDEVLLEEIRTYKVKLNCPCCSTRKKDTVLTKCFHVFCSECIRSRYDSRLRKCPKCGAAFGANDFHKLYLS